MRKGAKYSEKDKKEIIEKVLKEFLKEDKPIAEILKEHGVKSDSTFYAWINSNKEFKEKYYQIRKQKDFAGQKRRSGKAKRQLERLIEGFEVDASETVIILTGAKVLEDGTLEVNSEGKIKGRVTSVQIVKKKKIVLPSLSAIKFQLINDEEEKFQPESSKKEEGAGSGIIPDREHRNKILQEKLKEQRARKKKKGKK